jgi:hypothetical protein
MNTPIPEAGTSTRATDLLSLLKFRQSSQPAATSPPVTESIEPTHALPTALSDATSGAQGRPVSAADLVAGFTRKPSTLGSMQSPTALAPTSSRPELRGEASASSAKSQDFLLRLLNHQAKPIPSDAASIASTLKQPEHDPQPVPEAVVDDLTQDMQDATLEQVNPSPALARHEREESPMHVFGETTPPASTFAVPESAPKSKVFTYVNPFETLAASSPRNRTPKPESQSTSPKPDAAKHARDASFTSAPPAKTRKVSPDKPTNTPLSPTPAHRETVSEALSEVGHAADKQVEEALAQMTSKAHGDSEPKESKAEKAVREAAKEIKIERKEKQPEAGPSNSAISTTETPTSAAAGKPAADEDWEQAAHAAEKLAATKHVKVFNFPMRPFIAIDIKQLEEPTRVITPESFQDIARMTKPFDQIDRNLVSGSVNFMVYPLKMGGLRVIKQEDGSHKQIFSSFKERIFNVGLSHSNKGVGMNEVETVLATGVNGTVFWAPLANFPRDESFGNTEEERGIIFPPVPTNDENTSGGQLKTRVKPSSRTPEFFGYGRGKNIFIVFPAVARTGEFSDSKTRVCDSEKYLKTYQLKVSTGKAGKDFIFSADDTIIVSLDKSGRLKFWDIRPLTQDALKGKMPPPTPMEVKTPLMTLTTCLPSEKSWPTSVMLLDKEKPMAKGIALRYVIIGMKQNHTLQIWDLSLGKPVEEINFPHDQESDAICSIAYHPRTGILAVGHPTRNSVYLLHVSAPQYNLAPMSQAKFISALVNKDKSLPAPQSTIIISGIREFSLGSKGTIRSLDMLHEPGPQFGDDAPMFVLYIMHSKGISEMRVTREHLGWSEAGKILNPVNAQKLGAIVVSDIRPLPAPVGGDSASVTSESPAPTVVASSSKSSKDDKKVESTPSRERKATTEQTPKAEIAPSNGEKSEKKKRKEKKIPESASQTTSTAASPFVQPSEPVSRTSEVERPKSPSPLRKAKAVGMQSVESDVPSWATRLLESVGSSSINNISTATASDTTGFETLLVTEFENLYRKIGEDKRVQEAAGAAKQEAVLRLVSSTLAENVEGALNRVVGDSLTKLTLGPMKDVITSTIDKNLSSAFSQALKIGVPRELEKILPGVVGGVFKDPKTSRVISDLVAGNVAQQVDHHLAAILRDTIAPTFAQLAANTANKMAADVERRFAEQIHQAELQHQRDDAKIDHLLKTVGSLQELVHAMADSQVKFQNETKTFLLQSQAQAQQVQTPRSREIASGATPQTPAQPFKTPEELERDAITMALRNGELETATVKVREMFHA